MGAAQTARTEKADIIKFPEDVAAVTPNRNPGYLFIKRVFDIAGSLLGLVVLSPVFLVAAAAIYLDDPGPVLFFQDRNGLDGKVFRMWKFRSMCKDAPEQRAQLESRNELDGPAFKIKDDPRVTRVGKFLRHTSIDELPQLVNILKGEMSFVGPRPLPTYETEKCSAPQKQRLLVKPGLTCYWQVGGRSDTTFQEWMEMDQRYVREQGIWTDIKIFAATFPAVFSRRGGVLGQLRRQAYACCKRLFDILASLIGLMAFLPVLLPAAFAVKLENPKSRVFFHQLRIGRGGKEFRCHKLTSMVPDAEERLERMSDAEKKEFAENFKLRNDPRVTRVGRFLRKTSIDELPQLWNVLVGEMSLVGPRPPLLAEREAYGEHLDKVMSVRPGITGYWQVHGRSDTDFAVRIRMAEYYIDHRGIRMDIGILLDTVKVVLTGRGAV